MQWHIALHMHGDITLNGCECTVGKSILCFVFDLVGSIDGTTSNRVAQLNKMVMNICDEYQQEGIDPPASKKNPPIMVRHSLQR